MDESRNSSRAADADRYVDGMMTADEAAAFVARLSNDAALRDDVESLRAVDASLRRVMGDWREHSPRVSIEITGRKRRSSFRAAMWILAAASFILLVLAGGSWWSLQQPTSAERLYAAQVESGFEPGWVCDTDFEFARWTNNRLRQPLVPADPMPDDVQTLGWSFVIDDSPLSAQAAVMLATRGSEHVLVLVDRLENDRRVRVSGGSDLSVFRRELGPLVLYEISPLKSPSVLDAIRLAPLDIFDHAESPGV